ncbi:MAG: cytidylate kinase family protein [Proteobacteria bacterium]|nr:cytidylate kinase family protein [Pseudomonadota bacterium]MBU1741248.1 cytidylate kinase family protein [Pseudomonadota bacterium]
MSIITISRGSYSKGKEIAEKVAHKLGYECVSRDILLEASDHFNISEVKLVRALHDAPSVLERFTYGKERYLAFIEAAFMEHVQKDNVVYHGLAGHFFLKGVGHVLKVRIISDLEDRVRLEMEREGISEDKARHVITKDDYERRQWARTVYGIDTSDSSLYDLVIHIRKITVDEAVDLICNTVGLAHFQATSQSQKALDDLVLAARAKVAIVEQWPNVKVTAQDGTVYVNTEVPLEQEAEVLDRISAAARKVEGVEDVRISTHPVFPGGG